MDEDQWLKYARNLGFHDTQYEEAVKLIGVPDSANRFLTALIDVSTRQISNNLNHQTVSQQSDKSMSQLVTPTTDSLAPVKEQNDDTRSLASSSSCYSSITSVPSLPSDNLKKIFIDGPNVARTHGKDATFSWLGIKICIRWFLARDHRCKVFVPEDRCQLAEPSIISYLNDHDALIKTPVGCNDDLFVIEAAMQSNAIIVSNDLFRDESRFNIDMKSFIRSYRLPYVFVDDLFIPAPDPLGKMGPTLDEFLKNQPSNTLSQSQQQESFHNKLTKTKSHQRNNGPSSMRQQQQHQSFHRSLQASRSLPIQQHQVTCFNTNVGEFHQPHVSAMNNRSYQSDNQTNHRLRQSLRKSISVVYMQNKDNATTVDATDTERKFRGTKQALCRTKSHNI